MLVLKGVARGGPRGPPPSPEKKCFKIFRLNFSWDMSKMHYFIVTFFRKSPSAGDSLPPPALLKPSIMVTCSSVIWQNCVFSNWLWRNRTSKNSCDVISVTTAPLRHQNHVTNFFQFGPLPIKISGYASVGAWLLCFNTFYLHLIYSVKCSSLFVKCSSLWVTEIVTFWFDW